MIRVLLGLALAAAAFFGPWAMNSASLVGAAPTSVVSGEAFAGATVDCLLNQEWSVTGACAPDGGLIGKAITATVLFGVASAALAIIGLIPVIGRLTSVSSIIAGGCALAAFGLVLYSSMTGDISSVSDLRWGAYATGVFGLLTVFSGMSGMSGQD